MIGITRSDGTELRITFQHKQHKNEKGQSQMPVVFLKRFPPRKKRDVVKARAITYCFLETGDKKLAVRIATGVAVCVWADRNPNETSAGFTKAEGRARAFDKMLIDGLQKGVIEKGEVGPLRASYFNRANRKKGSAQPATN